MLPLAGGAIRTRERSSTVERLAEDQRVAGATPAVPTTPRVVMKIRFTREVRNRPWESSGATFDTKRWVYKTGNVATGTVTPSSLLTAGKPARHATSIQCKAESLNRRVLGCSWTGVISLVAWKIHFLREVCGAGMEQKPCLHTWRCVENLATTSPSAPSKVGKNVSESWRCRHADLGGCGGICYTTHSEDWLRRKNFNRSNRGRQPDQDRRFYLASVSTAAVGRNIQKNALLSVL